MKIEQTKIGWGFWLMWVLATTVGIGIGYTVISFLGFILKDIYFKAEGRFIYLLEYFIFYIVISAGVGIMQWLVLRRRVSRAGWWAPAIVAGFVLASVLFYYLPKTVDPNMFLPLGGALAGVLQCIFMERYITRLGSWVFASAMGWSLGAVYGRVFIPFPFVDLGFGIIMGAITGGAFVLLFRQPVNVK